MALTHCILGRFLGVGCHCFPPPLDVPTFVSRGLHVQATWETSISERRNYGREMAGQFCLWFRLPRKPRVLWHAAKTCDMGDGFTSPPRKACCGFFSPGSNPRSWVPEASMLTTRPPKPHPWMISIYYFNLKAEDRSCLRNALLYLPFLLLLLILKLHIVGEVQLADNLKLIWLFISVRSLNSTRCVQVRVFRPCSFRNSFD